MRAMNVIVRFLGAAVATLGGMLIAGIDGQEGWHVLQYAFYAALFIGGGIVMLDTDLRS